MKYIIPFLLLFIYSSINAQNIVFIVIDGARYSETFGDTSFTNIPNMAQLATQGTYLDEMYNEHKTKTKNAIPALWTGSWDGSYGIVYEGIETQATHSPSIFEYYRKQKNAEASQCYYMIKEVPSLWLQSFHSDYGVDYWPTVISEGSTDADVLNNTLEVMENIQPPLLWVYLADVDEAGHSGNWQSYISKIQKADELVNTLWTTIQASPFYKDNTTMIVTNDHGRHDFGSEEFVGHGCSCKGCQHIMFLALGPSVKENYISTNHYELADAAVTTSFILDIKPEFATGEIITDLFKAGVVSNIETANIFPQLRVAQNKIDLVLAKPDLITLEIYDIKGRKMDVIINNKTIDETASFTINHNYARGIYVVRLKYGMRYVSEKFFVF